MMAYPAETLTYAWFIDLFICLAAMVLLLTAGILLGLLLEKIENWIKRRRERKQNECL